MVFINPPDPLPPFTAVRPRDLLVLRVRFEHCDLALPAAGQPARVVPRGSAATPPLVVVDFPAQAIEEQAFGTATAAPRTGDVIGRYSGLSRLVFVLPPESEPIEYRLDAILERCGQLPMRLFTGATVDRHPFEVDPDVTALEIPSGLVLSPTAGAAGTWEYAPRPVTGPTGADGGAPVELWHARLAGDRVRAIGNHPLPPLRSGTSTLSEEDRRNLALHGQAGDATVEVSRLLLTSLGAWFDARGAWDDVEGNDLKSWRHRMTMGRDHFVQVVSAGFLFPLGHRAVAVVTSRRQIEPDANGTLVALIRKELQVFVRQPEREHVLVGAPPPEHRELPFVRSRLATVATPVLLIEGEQGFEDIRGKKLTAFWPKRASDRSLFRFHVVGTDRQGNQVEMRVPLAFIAESVARADASVQDWMTSDSTDSYTSTGHGRVPLGGQRLAFAEASSLSTDRTADSTFETDAVELGARQTSFVPDPPPPGGVCPFRPVVRSARAVVPAVREATGGDGRVGFRYDRTYVGGGNHPLDAFASLVDPVVVGFDSQQGGGLAKPDFSIARLSRTLGALGPAPPSADPDGPPDLTKEGTFDPKVFFAGTGPKLLGIFDLVALLPEQQTFQDVGQAFGSGPKIPRLATNRAGNVVRTQLQWDTPLVDPFAGATLSLDVTREVPDGGTPKVTSTGTLTGFGVEVPPGPEALVELPLNSLTFTSQTGCKPDVEAEIGDLRFKGRLEFVNTLADVLDKAGFVDPPTVEVTPEGVEVSYTLGIPTVTVGAFSLQNLSFSAGFALPLLDSRAPGLRLAFAERHNPCILTYGPFGGGAFVAVILTLGGMEVLEGSLEFGGATALDLGVASGGVAVMAGIYYSMEQADGTTKFQLAGFVRCVGALEVLGLISITVQFYLELRYADSPTRLSGTASLTVEVEVLFFSESVTMTVHREFAKSGDPTFEEVIPTPALWSQYCDAFEKVS